MKKDIHPKEYRTVLFLDNSNGSEFLIASAVHTTEKAKAKIDGKEYPLFNIETSSASHPFYTGNEKIMDTAGRIDRFKAKQAKAKKLTK
jgi:large subunit ribosomal protein L31